MVVTSLNSELCFGPPHPTPLQLFGSSRRLTNLLVIKCRSTFWGDGGWGGGGLGALFLLPALLFHFASSAEFRKVPQLIWLAFYSFALVP